MNIWVYGFFVAVASLVPFAALATNDASVPAPTFNVGDSWVFNHVRDRGADGFAQELRNVSIARVDSDSMLVDVKPDGSPRAPQELKVGLDWTEERTINGTDMVIGEAFSFPMSVGKTWTVGYTDPTQRGQQFDTRVNRTYSVVDWEDITVPAGTFHVLKIEDRGTLDARISIPAAAVGAVATTATGGTAVTHTQRARVNEIHETVYGVVYYSPAVKYFVKTLDEHYNGDNVRVSRETEELTSFRLAPSGGQSNSR